MEHIAIDLGGRESQICVRDAEGKIIEERRVPTGQLPFYLQRRPPARVIVETCAESFAVADAGKKHGHEIRVVPSTLVRSLGVGERRTKNDKRDAQKLSEVSCRIDLPSVHVPSAESRERKRICGTRDALVHSRVLLSNCVRGWIRTLGGGRKQLGTVPTMPARVRMIFGAELPEDIERLLVMIEQLTVQIRHADKQIAQIARTDDVCRRLMTVPGVGEITAVRFRAVLDQIERFEGGAHAVQSYLGLVPGESSSGERKQRLSITKAGSTVMRWNLIQAAWASRNCHKPHPMVTWSLEVEKRRGKRIAIVALARKIAGILYAIWRDGTVYDSTRGATIVDEVKHL